MFRVGRAFYFLPLAAALALGQSCSYFSNKNAVKPAGPEKAKEAAEAAAVQPPAPGSDRELPMYGGKVKSFKERGTPYNIAQAQAMSRDAMRLGWFALLKQQDTREAMARFNQAWVTDPENYEVYWGFGMVENAKAFVRGEDTAARLQEAAKWQTKAYLMGHKDIRVLLDLTNTYNQLGYYYQATKGDDKAIDDALARGEGCARKCCQVEPKNARAHFLFAANLYYQKRYQEAWQETQVAQSLGFTVPVKFIANLNKHMGDNKK